MIEHNSTKPPTESPEVPRLALRAKQAAAALGIGERKLWELTNMGLIPHVRIGRAIVYPVQLLEEWLSEQAGAKAGRG